jgi:hypothetical protein
MMLRQMKLTLTAKAARDEPTASTVTRQLHIAQGRAPISRQLSARALTDKLSKPTYASTTASLLTRPCRRAARQGCPGADRCCSRRAV